MNEWLTAAGAGLLAGGALFVGALIAWFVNVPARVVASIMAFGAGVLISALAFDLVGEAMAESGLVPTVSGFAVGAIVYVGVNILLDARDARNRRGSAEGRVRRGVGAAGVGVRFVVELEAGKPTVRLAQVLRVLHALGGEIHITGLPEAGV